jgi:hypothetical protein
MSAVLLPLDGAEEAEVSFKLVAPEIDAVPADDLTPMNVDVVVACCLVLEVEKRLHEYREKMARLDDFEVRHLDMLRHYAMAALFLYASMLVVPPSSGSDTIMQELMAIRARLLRWANPFADEGVFDAGVVARIREGTGHKDAALDVMALIMLFRAAWETVKSQCPVTEPELERGALVGAAAFASIGRREAQGAGAPVTSAEGMLRVRRAWTLVDRAYGQCRRAIGYIRFKDNDAESVAPNLRRNSGKPTAAIKGGDAPAPSPAVLPLGQPVAPPDAPVIGSGGSPFLAPGSQGSQS